MLVNLLDIFFFASDELLEILSSCKRWYLDGTFRLVKKPFMQLFSIHGFVKNSKGEVKQLPLGCFNVAKAKARLPFNEMLFSNLLN